MAAKALPEAAYLRECFDYDPETGVLTWKHRPREHFPKQNTWLNWNERFPGKSVGSVERQWGYVNIKINSMSYRAHRIIWKMQTGAEPLGELDHINRDPADNRWPNLRLASSSENTCNSVRGGRDLPKGVTRFGKNYQARCGLGGRIIHLGTFPTPEQAHAAYCVFAREHHGEFFFSGEVDASHC